MRKMAKLLKNQMRLHNIETSLKIKPNILIFYPTTKKIREFSVLLFTVFSIRSSYICIAKSIEEGNVRKYLNKFSYKHICSIRSKIISHRKILKIKKNVKCMSSSSKIFILRFKEKARRSCCC